ncbi:unnamed protein product, partial [Symbiodinium microadriaticum]
MLRGLLKLLSKIIHHCNQDRNFINAIVGENCEHLHTFLDILDVVQTDDEVVTSTNSVLYGIVSNIEVLRQILDYHATYGSDTTISRRWLMTVVAMLSSNYDWMQEVFYTDMSPLPVITADYKREIYFPLAESVKVKFRPSSSLPRFAELTIQGDPLDLSSIRVFSSGTQLEDFTFKGGRLTIDVQVTVTGDTDTICEMNCGYVFDVKPIFGEAFSHDAIPLVKVVGRSCLDLVLQGLRSPDEMTELFASRALANMMFTSASDGRREVLRDGLPRLTGLLEDEVAAVFSSFEMFNLSAEAKSVCANLTVQVEVLNIPPLQIGDVVGMVVDMVLFKVTITVNGKYITQGACFDARHHGGNDLWACGFQPAFFLNEETIAPVIINFGHRQFSYPPEEHHSLLEVIRKESKPTHLARLSKWQCVKWKVYAEDATDGSGYRPVHDADGLFISKREIQAAHLRNLVNHKRQIARGLYGASPLRECDVDIAIRLALSPDEDTAHWAIRTLLKVIEYGKHHLIIFRHHEVISRVLEICLHNTGLFPELCNSFSHTETVSDFMMQYFVDDVEEEHTNTLLIESNHPYVSNTENIHEIYFPGRMSIEIVFDPATVTEECFDYVVFYRKNPRLLARDDKYLYQISDKFSGTFSSKWPGFSAPLLLPFDRVWVEFVSNDEKSYWGYRTVARGNRENLV